MTGWIDWNAMGLMIGSVGTLIAAGVAMLVAYRVGRLHTVAAEQDREAKSGRPSR